MVMRSALILLLPVLLLSTSGCGLLLGNVKPMDEKSDRYRVIDLAKADRDWVKLEPTKIEPAKEDGATLMGNEVTDLAFQSKKTASIISLNSSCRPKQENEEDLHEVTRLLLLGISDTSLHEEKTFTLQGVPALETTVRGQLNGESMMLRTVVVRKAGCIYDLMYISRPEFFQSQEPAFAKFAASLKLD
jgi:hypothetical protein